MTQEDYIKFAKMFSLWYVGSDLIPLTRRYIENSDIRQFQEAVTDIFANDNPRFNREKFCKACEK